MPRLVPTEPDFFEALRAERTVWTSLRTQLADEAVLFHGQRFQERALEAEADLIVAIPGAGWAVIEVKGGDVRREQGQWEQRQKGVWTRIDPVGQAQTCRHVLQRYLQRHGSAAYKARTVHMIAVPDRDVPSDFESPDCPRALVLGRNDLATAAQRVLLAIQEHGQGHSPLLPDDLDTMVQAIQGTGLTQAELLTFAAEHDERLQQMTQDQTSMLDLLRNHHRLAVVGGAGSGKTWVALEQTRRLARSGQRVALVCYSRGLAHFLRRITEAWPRREQPAYVGLFHELPVRWGAPRGQADDSTWWEEQLPALLGTLAAAQPEAERYDSIVVDEAQDFSTSWWPPTLQALKDPDRGGLYLFLDEGQRIFPRAGGTPIELAPFPLDRNLRNTKRIAQVFGSLSLEQQKYAGLEGPPVRFVQCSSEDAVEVADAEVERLLDLGWEPTSVALLTTRHRHWMQKDLVERHGWDAYWDEFFDGDDVFYGHVLGFKGLERQVVVLAVNGVRDSERAKEMLYVGLSRARTQLVVCGDLELIGAVGGVGVRDRLARAMTAASAT